MYYLLFMYDFIIFQFTTIMHEKIIQLSNYPIAK